jgi:hypothetical protein
VRRWPRSGLLAAVLAAVLGALLLAARARFVGEGGDRRFEWGLGPLWSEQLAPAALIEATAQLGAWRWGWALAAGVGGALLARALVRRGARRGPWLGLGLAAALFCAADPGLLGFVARRQAAGAGHYLEVEDAVRGSGVLLLAAGLAALWPRRGRPTGERGTSELARKLSLAAACAVAGLVPLLFGAHFLGGEPLTNDGRSYRLQGELFAEGRATLEVGAAAPLFPARQVLVHEGRLASKYPPGHALFLAPGTALGWPKLLPQIGAALVPLLVYAMARRLGAARPLLAAWLYALSPTPLVLGGLWLSHGTSLPCAAAFAAAALRGLDRAADPAARRVALDGCAAGLALGLCALARPGTAVALALPFVIALALRPRLAARLVPGAVLGVLPAAGFFAAINAATTGSALLPAYVLYARTVSPDDTWGLANWASAGPHTALNGARLDLWLHGFAGSAALAVLGLASGELRRRALLCAVPRSLAAFYALLTVHGVPWAGPLYWVEAFPLLAIASAAGLHWLAERSSPRAIPAAVGASLAGSLLLLAVRGPLARAEVELRRAPQRAAESSGFERGVVLVPVTGELELKRWFLAPPVEWGSSRPLPPLVFVAVGPGPAPLLPAVLADWPRGRFDPQRGTVEPLAPASR